MVFIGEDKTFIKILYLIIGYGLRRLLRDCPSKEKAIN